MISCMLSTVSQAMMVPHLQQSYKVPITSIRYLSICPYQPIMHPTIIDGTTTHDLLQDISLGNFHSQKLTKGIVTFKDGEEGRIPKDKWAIACIALYVFGVAIHC